MAQCPHCQSPLPDPPGPFCPSCGGVLSVPGPPPPAPLAGPRIPWEERARLGLPTALFETTRDALLEPTRFFRRMSVSGGIGAPLGYGMIVGCLGIFAAALYQALFRMVAGPALLPRIGRYGELSRVMAFAEGGAGFVLQLLLGPVVLLLWLFLAAGIYHLVLMLVSGAKRGFEATFRVVCYSNAASALLIVPFCGNLLSFVWGIVLAIIGLAEAHGIGKGTAAAAVLLPILVLACCCAGLVTVLIVGGAASLSRFMQQ